MENLTEEERIMVEKAKNESLRSLFAAAKPFDTGAGTSSNPVTPVSLNPITSAATTPAAPALPVAAAVTPAAPAVAAVAPVVQAAPAVTAVAPVAQAAPVKTGNALHDAVKSYITPSLINQVTGLVLKADAAQSLAKLAVGAATKGTMSLNAKVPGCKYTVRQCFTVEKDVTTFWWADFVASLHPAIKAAGGIPVWPTDDDLKERQVAVKQYLQNGKNWAATTNLPKTRF